MDNKTSSIPIITYKVLHRNPGEAVVDGTLLQFMYGEHMQGIVEYSTWEDHMLRSIQMCDRYEMYMLIDDKVVGAAALVTEYDMHVGECMSVMLQYVLPEYRSNGFARTVLKTARYLAAHLGIGCIAFAVRKSSTSFNVRYSWVK